MLPQWFFSLLFLVTLFFPTVVRAESLNAIDPVEVGVGGRTLGMGNVSAALSKDATGLFTNAAGTAHLQELHLTSLYYSLLGDINYTVAGGAMPTPYGILGVGYVGAAVDDIVLVDASGNQQTAGYRNNLALVSLSAPLEHWVKAPFAKGIDAGVALKYYFPGFSGGGSSTSGGSGTGYDLDLGLQYQLYPHLTLGLSAQNVLPSSLGAKINYASGYSEGIASRTLLGGALKLVGTNGLSQYGANEVTYAMDLDFAFASGRQMLIRQGLEWSPVPFLALRVGQDQTVESVGTTGNATSDTSAAGMRVVSNLTAGVGVMLDQFSFDYAFHKFNDLDDNDTHYFSISYSGGRKTRRLTLPERGYVEFSSPSDRFVTRLEKITVSGTIRPEVEMLVVNGETVPVSGEKFTTDVPLLDIGKNLIEAKVKTAEGREERVTVRVLRLPSFPDVSEAYWAREPVEQLATVGLIEAFPDGYFYPDQPITRAEFAALLVRAEGVDVPRVYEQSFPDLEVTQWSAPYIEAAVKRGLMVGFEDKTFRPKGSISRAEAVLAMTRFDRLRPERVSQSPYQDIPLYHWAADAIAKAKSMGMLDFVKGNLFEPTKPITRAEAVAVMSKTIYGQVKVKTLFDWESGYEPSTYAFDYLQ